MLGRERLLSGEAEGDGKEKDASGGPVLLRVDQKIVFWEVRAGEDHLQTLMTDGDMSGVGCVALTGAVVSLPPD